MKLSGEEYLRVSRLRPTTNTSTLGSIATAPMRRDPPESDIDPRDIKIVTDAITAQPDIREQVVASLRERIESGTYFVSGEQIAEMMIRRLLADRVRWVAMQDSDMTERPDLGRFSLSGSTWNDHCLSGD